MKPEARLYIKGHDGRPFGPIGWTSVREWVANGYFGPKDQVRKMGESAWTLIGENHELLALPRGERDDAAEAARTRAHEKKPLGPRAAAYLARLGSPVDQSRLNPFSAFYWVRFLEALHPDRVDATEHWAAEEEANGHRPAATPADATAEQIELLRSRGLLPPGNLTRLEARRLMSGPPSEEQLERLKFWGMPLPPGACQEEAAELISRQMRENWDAEMAFQAHHRRVKKEANGGDSAALKLRRPVMEETIGTDSATLPVTPDRSVPHLPLATHRRGSRGVALAIAIATALGAVGSIWFAAKRNRLGDRATASASAERREPPTQSAAAAAPAHAITLLESANPELGERLRKRVMAFPVTSIVVVGAEPRALIGGRLYRVGDIVDPNDRVFMLQIDPRKRAVVFTDAGGSIVQRVLD